MNRKMCVSLLWVHVLLSLLSS